MKFGIFLVLAVAAAAIFMACRQTPQYVGAAVDHDQNVLTGGPITGVTLQDLPPAVKATLKARVPHAKVDLIDKNTRQGVVVYEFTFTEDSDTPNLSVSEDGRVLPESTKERG